MPAKKPAANPDTQALRAIGRHLADIHLQLRRIARALRPRPTLGLHIHHLIAKGIAMPPIPIPTLNIDPALFVGINYATDPRDANGNPTKPALAWASSDPSVLEVQSVSADTLSAVVTIKAEGKATISVTNGPITDSQDVTVGAAPPVDNTVTLGLTATPVLKP